MLQSPTLARIAGVLYLAVGVFGGFSQGYFQPLLYRAGDAAATFAQVQTHAGLVPWGVMADLVQVTAFVFLVLILEHLLRPFGAGKARAMRVLVVLAAAVMALNNTFEYGALRAASDGAFAAAFGGVGQQALVYLLLDLQHTGVLVAQVFFGLWLVPLGLLVWDSRWFPRWLGVLLAAGGVCYLVNLTTLFLTPEFGALIAPFIVIPSAAAEITMVVYLLVFGVRKDASVPSPTPTTGPNGSA